MSTVPGCRKPKKVFQREDLCFGRKTKHVLQVFATPFVDFFE